MKFEFEKFDAKAIERCVREEQCRTGKRVTKVILTHAEWGEFAKAQGLDVYMPPHMREYRIPLHVSRCYRVACDCTGPTDSIPVIRITCEP